MQLQPGSIVRCRNRDWVLIPSEQPEVHLLRPLTGATDDVVAIHGRLAEIVKYSLSGESVSSATRRGSDHPESRRIPPAGSAGRSAVPPGVGGPIAAGAGRPGALLPAASLGQARPGADPPPRHQVVLPLRLPVELPQRPSVLHQRLHRLLAQMRILLREQLLVRTPVVQEGLRADDRPRHGRPGAVRRAAGSGPPFQQHGPLPGPRVPQWPHAVCPRADSGAPPLVAPPCRRRMASYCRRDAGGGQGASRGTDGCRFPEDNPAS
jgi:hypothetical protein